MDWDKLRVFKAVADAGSFTRAGEILNLSQSAVSRQISALEESLGIPLFHRHARGLILTEQGDILFNTTCNVFDKLEKVQTDLTDSKMLPQGPLKVTTVEFIASTWLVPQLPLFHKNFPDIQLTVFLDDRVYDLSRREADIAIRLRKSQNSDLIERHLTTIHFRLCVSKDYIEKNGKPKSLKDLKNHTMIGYPPNLHTPYSKPNWIFNQAGIDMINNNNVLMMNSMNARYMSVKNGLGIAVLPEYIPKNDPQIETLFDEELQIPDVDMYFAYPQERRNSKRIAVLRDFLFQQIKNKN
tara:strand:- start:1375 stop:2265 length:891 start_codon:yes stop_codon:yes gene_type:complete